MGRWWVLFALLCVCVCVCVFRPTKAVAMDCEMVGVSYGAKTVYWRGSLLSTNTANASMTSTAGRQRRSQTTGLVSVASNPQTSLAVCVCLSVHLWQTSLDVMCLVYIKFFIQLLFSTLPD
jgi:hypothetical protein